MVKECVVERRDDAEERQLGKFHKKKIENKRKYLRIGTGESTYSI